MNRVWTPLTIFFLSVLILSIFPSWAKGEPLAVIVNPKNEENNVAESTIAAMFRGELLHWRQGGRIKLVNREISADTREQFYRSVLNARPDQTFYRPGTPVAVRSLIQRSDEAVLRFVASIDGAIGYVKLSKVTDSVKVVQIIPDG